MTQPALFPDLTGPAERLQAPQTAQATRYHGPPTPNAPTAPHGGQETPLDLTGGVLIPSGKLTVTLCPDGRVLLWLTTSTRGGAWLELYPLERAWLRDALDVCVRVDKP